jgi:DNA invertase Pin-like site-specific DNA recombinase
MSDAHETANTQPKSAVVGGVRAVAYARVSTGWQELSLEHQERVMRAECERRGWSFALEFDSASGKTVRNRRGLQRALAGLAAGEFGALVVSKLDRLSRSLLDTCELMDRAQREGWALVCLSPAVDLTDPFGRAMAQVAGAFAELERGLISQRQKDSVAARRAAGTYRRLPPEVSAEAEERIAILSGRGIRCPADHAAARA